MTRTHSRHVPFVVFLSLFCGAFGLQAAGPQNAGPAAGANVQSVQQPPTIFVSASSPDARATRKELEALLDKAPPALGRVLKLDPTLLTSQAYLAPYPAVAAFLAAHPEVARDPRFFLENVQIGYVYQSSPPDPRVAAVQMWERMLAGAAALLVFIVITAVVAWLVKSLIDHRRWMRLSKVQVEVHNKLLERFGSSDELLGYVRSPAGRQLLESVPTGLEPTSGDIGVPLRRILWAIQAGLVLVAAGAGLLFVSGVVPEDVASAVFAIGAVVVAVGIGFILAAGASYALTRRLGLLVPVQLSDRRPGVPAEPGA